MDHLASSASARSASFDYHLEGLRGLAALLVVLSHVLTNNFHLDPGFRFTGIWQYSPPGTLCVLVFFILSGYVIGLTNKKPINTNEQRLIYLKKRLVRLYPLYLVAIMLALGVATVVHIHYPPEQIGLHLLFGQVAFTDVLMTNEPLWSLSFEMLYYMLFLIFSYYQWRSSTVIFICVVIGVITKFLPGAPLILSAYSYGACFWLIGLLISQLPKREAPVQFGNLFALLLLLLCYDRMNIWQSLLAHTPMDFTEQEAGFFQRPVRFSDFSSLLFCVPLLLRFTNRHLTGFTWLERSAFLTPVLYLVGYIISDKIYNPKLVNTLVGPVFFYLLALLVYFTTDFWQNFSKNIVKKLASIGTISYGIYIIHFPLIILFEKVTIMSGSSITFVIRFMFFILIVLLLGYLLEKKLQPRIRSIFF